METSKNPLIKYEDFLVAFIDLLGFESQVIDSCQNPDTLSKIDYALEAFSQLRLKSTWEKNRILMEIEEDAQKRNLNDYYIDKMVRCFCFSDSIIIMVKADKHIEERSSALVAMLSKIGADLLSKGILIRGAISFGQMHVDENSQSTKAFGPAIIDAYKLEQKQATYPRIVLSNQLINKLEYPLNEKYKRHPYHQYINRFEDGLVGFSQLTFFEVIQSCEEVLPRKDFFEMIQKSKKVIIAGLDENMCNAHVFEKYNWLKDEFNKLSIILRDESGERIKFHIYDAQIPDSRHNIHYSYINEFYDRNQ